MAGPSGVGILWLAGYNIEARQSAHQQRTMASWLQSFLDAPDYLEGSPWFPNPLICVRDMAITGSKETFNRLPWEGLGVWLNSTWYWISRAKYNDPSAILLPIVLAIGMTILRIFLNWSLFKVRHFYLPLPPL